MNSMNGILKRAAAAAVALAVALPCRAGGQQKSGPGNGWGGLLRGLSFSRGARPAPAATEPPAPRVLPEPPVSAVPIPAPVPIAEPDARELLGEHLAVVEQVLASASQLPAQASAESQAGAAARLHEAMTGEQAVPTAEAVSAAVAAADWSSLPLKTQVALAHARTRAMIAEVRKVIRGQDEAIASGLMAGVMANGAIFEAVPGTGKTELAKAIRDVVNVRYSRIQYTPDLMPADVRGSFGKRAIDAGEKTPETFDKGPAFEQMTLGDEINRAPPKVKAASLELLAEKQATVEGVQILADPRSFQLATMNPIEQEGTYQLSEAELDRYMFKVTLRQPTLEIMNEIVALNRSKESRPKPQKVTSLAEFEQIRKVADRLPVTQGLIHYSNRIALGAMPDADVKIPEIAQHVQYGVYTRAAINLIQAAALDAVFRGQDYVGPENVERMAPMVLRHRIVPTAAAMRAGWTPDKIIAEVIAAVSPRRPGSGR